MSDCIYRPEPLRETSDRGVHAQSSDNSSSHAPACQHTTPRIIQTAIQSRERFDEYHLKLAQRKEQKRLQRLGLKMDKVNGFSQIGRHGYLDFI